MKLTASQERPTIERRHRRRTLSKQVDTLWRLYFADRSFAFCVRWHREIERLYHNLRRGHETAGSLLPREESDASSPSSPFISSRSWRGSPSRSCVFASDATTPPPPFAACHAAHATNTARAARVRRRVSHRDGRFWLPKELVSEPRRGHCRSGCNDRRRRRRDRWRWRRWCSGRPKWLARSHGSIFVVVPRTRVVAADRARVLGREVHHVRRRETVLRVVKRGMVRARTGGTTATIQHRRRRRDRRTRRWTGTRAWVMLRTDISTDRRQEAHIRAAVAHAAPHPDITLPSLPHQRFVFGDAHLLAVNDARALRPRPVPIVRMFLHVQLR